MIEVTTVTVYLNSSSDVIALARELTGHTTAPVGNVADAVERIAGAPLGLVRKDRVDSDGSFYHRRTSGDGTDLSHYTQVEDLGPFRSLRKAEFDAATIDLLAQGFVYEGDTFSLSLEAQSNLTMLKLSENELIYPIKVSTLDNSKVIELANRPELQAFYEAAFNRGYVEVVTMGNTLKGNITAAATKSEIAAVVETRR